MEKEMQAEGVLLGGSAWPERRKSRVKDGGGVGGARVPSANAYARHFHGNVGSGNMEYTDSKIRRAAIKV
jgi:hypothetical protein